jgi:hypothetical protein
MSREHIAVHHGSSVRPATRWLESHAADDRARAAKNGGRRLAEKVSPLLEMWFRNLGARIRDPRRLFDAYFGPT